MNIEDPPKGNPYVDEKWWHRLLRVLMYASTCVVLVVAGFFLINDYRNYTYSYSYSFEPNYEQAEEEVTCSYDEEDILFTPNHEPAVSCGAIGTIDDLINRYQAANRSTSRILSPHAREKTPMIEPAPAKAVVKEYDESKAAREALIKDLKADKVRYRQAKHWKAGPLAQSVGLTLGIAIIWYVFTLMIYKVTLYIAYGHTRIRKV